MQQEKDQQTTWYHEGPEALQVSQLWIASEHISGCVCVCVCACVHMYIHFLMRQP